LSAGEAAPRRVSVEVEDGVAHVRLNRPDAMNALDWPLFEALVEAGENLGRDLSLRAVVLSGTGRAFCAGLDRDYFGAMLQGRAFGDITARTHGAANLPQRAALVWRDLPVPVIAAIHGVAFGGGLQLALAADLRFVAPDARLSVAETNWGLVPDMGGVLLMRHLMRADIVRDLTFTGRIVLGPEAVSLGLATALHEDPVAGALTAAREIACRSPDAVRAAKRLLNQAQDGDAAAVLLAESHAQAGLIGTANQMEAVRANIERRPPVFRVREGEPLLEGDDPA
jgi:enoyl-CoA hydratase/carnithine racemase